MPNIWHICHTKHQKPLLSDVSNLIKFDTCEQYRCKFATVRTRMLKKKIVFYSFSLILFYFFSSLSFFFFFLSPPLHLCHSLFLFSSSSFLLLSPEASLPLDFFSLALFHESRCNCSQKIIFLDINYFLKFLWVLWSRRIWWVISDLSFRAYRIWVLLLGLNQEKGYVLLLLNLSFIGI